MSKKARKTWSKQNQNRRRKAEYTEKAHFKCPRCKCTELEEYWKEGWGKDKRCAKCKSQLWKLRAMEKKHDE